MSRLIFKFKDVYDMGLDTRKPVFGVCGKKSADYPARMPSLISAFFIHLLDSIISKLDTCEIF